jgi:YHS domain-containing protein
MKTKSIQITKLLVTTAISLSWFTLGMRAANPISVTFFGSKAVGGYDTVAYHQNKKAIKGSKTHKTIWKGATWLFVSAENLRTFKGKPEKFAPAYGGYCAWAAGENKLVKADPTIFDLHNGRLFLNYNKKTRTDWKLDRKGMIKRGDSNYPRLIAE